MIHCETVTSWFNRDNWLYKDFAESKGLHSSAAFVREDSCEDDIRLLRAPFTAVRTRGPACFVVLADSRLSSGQLSGRQQIIVSVVLCLPLPVQCGRYTRPARAKAGIADAVKSGQSG